MGWSNMVGLDTSIDTRAGTSSVLDATGLPGVSFSGDGGLRFGHWLPWQRTYLPIVSG